MTFEKGTFGGTPASIVSEPNKQHLPAMLGLYQQGQKPHHDAFPEIFGPGDNEAAIKGYLRGFLKPRNPFRKRCNFAKGWFIDGELRGYLLYHLLESGNVFYGKSRWTCFVEDIVIDDAARGQGGASQLLDHLNTHINGLENCMISATVWNGNDGSVALFEKHGFEAQSRCFYRLVR